MVSETVMVGLQRPYSGMAPPRVVYCEDCKIMLVWGSRLDDDGDLFDRSTWNCDVRRNTSPMAFKLFCGYEKLLICSAKDAPRREALGKFSEFMRHRMICDM